MEKYDVGKCVLVICVCHEIYSKPLIDFLQQLSFDIMELLIMTSP
jgi:hypothetical protein